MRLFIIGNGFDLDHNIESRFINFKEYLEQTYLPTFNRFYPTYPNTGVDHDGDIVVDPNSSSQILYFLVSDVPAESDWSDFEECLGLMDYQKELDMVEEDENMSYYFQNLEDIVNNLYISLIFSSSNLFTEWVEQINYSNVFPKYRFLPSDLFLTFNYTKVLEDIYDINPENICHIHGSISERRCIIGHGNGTRNFDLYDELISHKISLIHQKLKKPTASLYYQHVNFFEKIYKSNIDQIVFFGFSLNHIDEYYLQQIFKNIDTSETSAYFSHFEMNHDHGLKEKRIKELGFCGFFLGEFI